MVDFNKMQRGEEGGVPQFGVCKIGSCGGCEGIRNTVGVDSSPSCIVWYVKVYQNAQQGKLVKGGVSSRMFRYRQHDGCLRVSKSEV